MNVIDLLIIALVVISLLRGFRLGMLRQAFSLAGFWVGFFLGSLLAVRVTASAAPASTKLFLALACVLGAAFLVSAAGEYLGFRLAQLAARIHAGGVDALLGGLLGALTSVVTVWLLAALLATPVFGLNKDLRNSKIVGLLSHNFPPPPAVIAQIERRILPGVFPKVFSGLAPSPAAPVEVALPAEVQAAVNADRESVVRVEGLSCNAISDGSGFVVADDLIMTNAHVVAGVEDPVVYDTKGPHDATVIYFDPNVDLAILRVQGLADRVLSFVPEAVSRGTKAAVLGYPGGGTFTAVSAGVTQQLHAVGRNIYDRDVSEREVYEIQADVEPGNSGGPLVLPDGRVIGVVFARSDTEQNLGYALTAQQVQSALEAAKNAHSKVSTEECVTE